LADDVVVHVSKRLNENSLVVECMMPSSGVGGYTTGSGDVAEFVFDPEMEDFVDGLVTLPEYLEDRFATHLKVMMNLKPDLGKHG